jgi:hypothetical protein
MPHGQQQGGKVEMVNKLDCREMMVELLKQFIGSNINNTVAIVLGNKYRRKYISLPN